MKNIILIGMVLLSGCATLLQPGPDKIPVRSEPEGAKVLLNGMPVGATPMTIEVGRKDNCSVDIQKDGYQTIHIDRHKVVSGWIFGNILLGGIVGIVIDLATENQGHYPNDPIYSVMQANDESSQRHPAATP